MTDEIRRIVGEHGRLAVDASTLPGDADLYQAGLTSHASVALMLALEDELDLEFPDSMLTRDVFSSIDSIAAAVATLRRVAA